MRIFSNWRAIVVERERLTYGSWEEKRRGFVFILYSHAKTMGVLLCVRLTYNLRGPLPKPIGLRGWEQFLLLGQQ